MSSKVVSMGDIYLDIDIGCQLVLRNVGYVAKGGNIETRQRICHC